MDGYVRVSHVGGRAGDRFQSPSAQRDAIEGWARAHGVTIAVIHEDLDRSGGTMDRPGMNEAIRRVEAGVTSGLIVARLDRFARTVIGGLTVITELNERGARVVSVAESIDPATPMGRAMLGLLLIMAEWQRDQASEHLIVSQRRAATAGRYAGRCPYGYMRTPAGLQVIDPDTAPVVRTVFEMRAARVGWRQITQHLDAAGILTATGKARWSAGTLTSMIRSEAYLGVFIGPSGLQVQDAWEPLVSVDVWNAANTEKIEPLARVHDDRLLAGIARCAECLTPLVRLPNHRGFVSYSCQTRGCAARCSIGITLLDDHLADLIDARLANADLQATVPNDDLDGDRLLTARSAASVEFEKWRDDLDLRAAIGDTDWREGIMSRAAARDATHGAYVEHRARIGLSELAVLPAGADRMPALRDLPWGVQRQIADAALYGVFLRPGGARGLNARRHVGDRVRVVWRDDPAPPALRDRFRDAPPPVRW